MRVAIKEYLPAHLAVRNDTHVSVRSSAEQHAFEWGLRQFLKEAQVLARFAHPNLVPVHRYFQAHGTAYFVMSYVEGDTLGQRLKQCPQPGEAWLRRVLLPVMDGLKVVHRAGFLHRDIKPENILLTQDDTPVLIDFGAARVNLDSATRSTLCALTAGYAPIEQYGSAGNQGPWTDLYALGAVAYRAVSGRKPPDAVNRIHHDSLVPARQLAGGRYSLAFLQAIDWALALHPDERPRCVDDWQQALAGPARSTGVRTVVTTLAPPAASGARKARWPSTPWATAAAPLVAAVAIGVALFGWQGMRATEPLAIAAPTMPAVALEMPPARATAVAAPARAPAAAPTHVATTRAVANMEALSSFQDCPGCPSMTVLPAAQAPRPGASAASPLAFGRYEVTVGQYQECVAAGACRSPLREARSGNLPVVNVSFGDAQAYARWLSRKTGRAYRLPTEAEWEYAARAGTRTDNFWGAQGQHCRYANAAEPAARACRDGHAGLAAVGSFRPNWFDLYDTAGNAWEWTSDCWRGTRAEAAGCSSRAVRGGSWRTPAGALRSKSRTPVADAHRSDTLGFRVVAP
jgi:formylglycine-generating enzyme required for sulfatase activity